MILRETLFYDFHSYFVKPCVEQLTTGEKYYWFKFKRNLIGLLTSDQIRYIQATKKSTRIALVVTSVLDSSNLLSSKFDFHVQN